MRKEKRKQAEQEIEKMVAEKDYDSIERKHRQIRIERYRRRRHHSLGRSIMMNSGRKDLDAIDPFLSSKSSLRDDVAVVMKHHRGLHRAMASITIQSGLYLVRPKDFLSDEEELWNSTVYEEESMDFSKTRTILPIKSSEKRTGIFIWTRCAQKRLIGISSLLLERNECMVTSSTCIDRQVHSIRKEILCHFIVHYLYEKTVQS